jgi:hypothetical protein
VIANTPVTPRNRHRRRAERLAADLACVTVEGSAVQAIDLSLGGVSFASKELLLSPGSVVSGHIVARTARKTVTVRFSGEVVWTRTERCAVGVRFDPMSGQVLDDLMVILSFLSAERDRLWRRQRWPEWLTGMLQKLSIAAWLFAAFAASAWASYNWFDLVVPLKS